MMMDIVVLMNATSLFGEELGEIYLIGSLPFRPTAYSVF